MAKLKILLAESSSIVLQIEQRCLKDAGVSIVTASDSEDAINTARSVRPNLIYLAYSLHGSGGIPCCKALKADPVLKDIPVVIVCAAGGEEPDVSRAAGCDGVVTKPVACKEFLETGLSLIPKPSPDGERIACRSIVACSKGGETFSGAIEDISVTGMFVGSSREVAMGDQVTMTFDLPWQKAETIETRGQVNWVNSGRQPRSDNRPLGFGVLFLELGEEAAGQIRDYIRPLKQQLEGK